MPKPPSTPTTLLPWMGLCIAAGLAITPSTASANGYQSAGVHAIWNPVRGNLGVGLRWATFDGGWDTYARGFGYSAEANWLPMAYTRLAVSARGGVLITDPGPFMFADGVGEAGLSWARSRGGASALQVHGNLAMDTQPGPYFFLRGAIPILGGRDGWDFEVGLGLSAPINSYVVVEGRPLRDASGRRVARLVNAGAWRAPLPDGLKRLPMGARVAAANAWKTAAQDEHAAIPAFKLLAHDLAMSRAPAHLIHAARRAAADEVRHARACLTMAARATGDVTNLGSVGAPPNTGEAHIDRLKRMAIEAWEDGCLGEGTAAAMARRSLSGAKEGQTRAVKSTIASDEDRHAELGWDVLAWALKEGGQPVRRAVASSAAMDGKSEDSSPSPFDAGRFGDALLAQGLLDRAARASARQAVEAQAYSRLKTLLI